MWRTAPFGLLLAAIATGCGGGEETHETNPTYAYPTEASYCEALAAGECADAVVKACYGSDETTLAEDQLQCIAARKTRCNPDNLPYRPEHAEGCLEARTAGLADAVWTHAELSAVETACLSVFSKEGPDGAVCTASTDCNTAVGLRCVVKLGSIEGVCGVPKVAPGGEDCADPVTICGETFYCDPGVSHCLAKPEEGEVCSAAAPCAADFYCTSPESGTCQIKTKNGLDCQKDELCAGGFCVGATTQKDGVCSATLPLQINAESCDQYRQ